MTNSGGGQISWQGATTQSWLMLSPRNGSFSSGQSIKVTIAADRSNLKPGAYAAGIIFTSTAGEAKLPVKMKTTPLQPGHEAVLQLTPAVLSFTAVDGGSNPPAQVLTVSDPGVQLLQWSASSSSNWLAITPQSGDVGKGGSQSVEIGVKTSALLPGTYSGVVTFTGIGPLPTRDSPQSIFVRSEEHTSELQSPCNLVCRLLLEKKNADPPAVAAAHAPTATLAQALAQP